MTHAELVARAVQWLRGSKGCGVVLAEYRCSSFYEPDAIGWKRGGDECFVVECKVSRSDFRADRKKLIHALPGHNPGHHRYYLTPPGLVRAEEVPEGWGLLEAQARQIKVLVEAPPCPPEERRARIAAGGPYLYSFARRTVEGVRFDPEVGRFVSEEDR